MSTKEHHGPGSNGAPVHADVTFEPRDIDIGTIARYLVYLAITIVIALVICVPIFNVLTKYVAEQDTPMPAVRSAMTQQQRDEQQLPPQPRLQGVPGSTSDPQQDLRDKIERDTEANEKFGLGRQGQRHRANSGKRCDENYRPKGCGCPQRRQP